MATAIHPQHLTMPSHPNLLLHRLLHCGDGTWQREYAQLHSSILAGRAEPRYLLTHGQNGAQRMTWQLDPAECQLSQASWPQTVHNASGTWPQQPGRQHVSAGMLAVMVESRDTSGKAASRWSRRRLHGGAAGLADSLVGAITLFWVAVLQRRAFAMKFGDEGAYEWAFDQPHINWTW